VAAGAAGGGLVVVTPAWVPDDEVGAMGVLRGG